MGMAFTVVKGSFICYSILEAILLALNIVLFIVFSVTEDTGLGDAHGAILLDLILVTAVHAVLFMYMVHSYLQTVEHHTEPSHADPGAALELKPADRSAFEKFIVLLPYYAFAVLHAYLIVLTYVTNNDGNPNAAEHKVRDGTRFDLLAAQNIAYAAMAFVALIWGHVLVLAPMKSGIKFGNLLEGRSHFQPMHPIGVVDPLSSSSYSMQGSSAYPPSHASFQY